ncbi:unnamed protein product [Brassicogethes aeneus]|uniref:Uncharacterized protein n=1 Tax=Brassicogethes aeneus TaxID=1431903 RepID=A0A9P0AYZ5_BRAAE|nr:unnamed protein product [Brassicogethes aeneus]
MIIYTNTSSKMDYNPHYYPHSKYYFAQKQLGYGPLNYIYSRPRRVLDWEWPYNQLIETLPSEYAFRQIRKMIYCSTPISGIDYTYYPETTKYYRPLTLHYNYYYPLRTLNYYSNEWPTYSYWPTYRYYKYLSWPSDRYWFLQRIFDDETRLIRAQSQSLLKRIHTPVPRLQKLFPITTYRYEDALPVRVSNDNYIHRMLTSSPTKASYTTYYTEPVRKYIGQGHLSCVSYAGDRAYNRRRNVWMYEDPMRNDIQLLSYYIQKFRSEKAQEPKIKEGTCTSCTSVVVDGPG